MPATTLISQICKGVYYIKHASSVSEIYNRPNPNLTAISKKLGLTKAETILFCMFMELCDDMSIRVGDIARRFDLSTIQAIGILGDVDGLAKKGYVIQKKDHNNNVCFRVPGEVIKAIREDRAYERKIKPGLKIEEFFNELNDIYTTIDDSPEEVAMSVNLLIDNNKHLEFCKVIRDNKWGLDPDERLLLVLFCSRLVNCNDDNITVRDWEDYFPNIVSTRFCNELGGGTSTLITAKLLEVLKDDDINDRNHYHLTRQAKEQILSELSGLFAQRAFESENLKKHDTLIEKKLFYNQKEEKMIGQLSSLIDEKSFCEVLKRLEDKGMRRGFCCLFYGGPGTGKTETVYQLARQTGRDLYVIDVSKIKSCWVGESEKNISKAFDDYRLCVKQSKENKTPAPILLFNEADAVLGIRREGASRSVDKMENSIQNIILQGMEDLEGIMIATTNLTQNLDKAFERRFLYKVKFEKPTPTAKQAIWKSMIPELADKDAAYLASKYDFSGGQIENIARKYAVEFVLSGRNLSYDEIEALCKEECIDNKNNKIGF